MVRATKGRALLQKALLLEAEGRQRKAGPSPKPQPESLVLHEEHVQPLSLAEAVTELTRQTAELIHADGGQEACTHSPDKGTGGPLGAAELSSLLQRLVQTAILAVQACSSAQAVKQQQGQPSTNSICSALLMGAALPIATLKQEFQQRRSAEEDARFQRKCMIQLLLRMHIHAATGSSAAAAVAAAGAGPTFQLSPGQQEEVEGLLKLLTACLHPIPLAGREFFDGVIRPQFGSTLPQTLRQLAYELWDEEDEGGKAGAVTWACLWNDIMSKEIDGECSGETGGPTARSLHHQLSLVPAVVADHSKPMVSGGTTAAAPASSARPAESSIQPGTTGVGGGTDSEVAMMGTSLGSRRKHAGGETATSRGANKASLRVELLNQQMAGRAVQMRLRSLEMGHGNAWQFEAQRQLKGLRPARRAGPQRQQALGATLPVASQVAKAKQQPARGSSGERTERVPDTPESGLKPVPGPSQPGRSLERQLKRAPSPPPSELCIASPPMQPLLKKPATMAAPGVIPSALPVPAEPCEDGPQQDGAASPAGEPTGPTWLVSAAAKPVTRRLPLAAAQQPQKLPEQHWLQQLGFGQPRAGEQPQQQRQQQEEAYGVNKPQQPKQEQQQRGQEWQPQAGLSDVALPGVLERLPRLQLEPSCWDMAEAILAVPAPPAAGIAASCRRAVEAPHCLGQRDTRHDLVGNSEQQQIKGAGCGTDNSLRRRATSGKQLADDSRNPASPSPTTSALHSSGDPAREQQQQQDRTEEQPQQAAVGEAPQSPRAAAPSPHPGSTQPPFQGPVPRLPAATPTSSKPGSQEAPPQVPAAGTIPRHPATSQGAAGPGLSSAKGGEGSEGKGLQPTGLAWRNFEGAATPVRLSSSEQPSSPCHALLSLAQLMLAFQGQHRQQDEQLVRVQRLEEQLRELQQELSPMPAEQQHPVQPPQQQGVAPMPSVSQHSQEQGLGPRHQPQPSEQQGWPARPVQATQQQGVSPALALQPSQQMQSSPAQSLQSLRRQASSPAQPLQQQQQQPSPPLAGWQHQLKHSISRGAIHAEPGGGKALHAQPPGRAAEEARPPVARTGASWLRSADAAASEALTAAQPSSAKGGRRKRTKRSLEELPGKDAAPFPPPCTKPRVTGHPETSSHHKQPAASQGTSTELLAGPQGGSKSGSSTGKKRHKGRALTHEGLFVTEQLPMPGKAGSGAPASMALTSQGPSRDPLSSAAGPSPPAISGSQREAMLPGAAVSKDVNKLRAACCSALAGGCNEKAIVPLEALLRVEPYDPHATCCLAGSLSTAGQVDRAMEVLEVALTQLDAFPRASSLRHVTGLADLYGRAERWGDVLNLARWAELQPQLRSDEHSGGARTQQCPQEDQQGAALMVEGGQGAAGDSQVPLELRAIAGTALAHLGEPEPAWQHLSSLLQRPAKPEHAGLYRRAADALDSCGCHKQARRLYRVLTKELGGLTAGLGMSR